MKDKKHNALERFGRKLIGLDRPLSLNEKKELATFTAGYRLQKSIEHYDGSSRIRTPTQAVLNKRKGYEDTLSAFSDNVRTVGTKKVKSKKKKK